MPLHRAPDGGECESCVRLRARIHEVAANGDRRNAELHRRVAHYEAIRDRVNPMIERLGQHTIDERGLHHWPALAHPGSMMGFWLAFQLALQEDPLADVPES